MAIQDLSDAGFSEHNLYRLLYCSQVSRAKPVPNAQGDIQDILRKSRHTNPMFGITGVLLTNSRMYSQMIEGPESAVKNLFGHISCDVRHRDIKVISHHASERRSFNEWSMAHVDEDKAADMGAAFFPASDGHSDIIAIARFCSVVRRHLLAAAKG